MAKWFEMRRGGNFTEIGRVCGISPVLARVIRNRGIIGAEETGRYLRGTIKDLRSPFDLPGIGKAAELLRSTADAGKWIRIIGDYDVDGICSTYILTRGLRSAGAQVDFVLPDRMRDGYGLNERMIGEAVKAGVQVIITCDNGIAAAEPIRRAKEAGLTVIVTDHHEVPFVLQEDGSRRQILPEADAVVEPKLVRADGTQETPYQDICGAVVALKLMQVFCEPEHPECAFETRKELFSDLITFAAFATVCDVMPLTDENRILVRFGLREAEHTANPGLKALIRVQGLEGRRLTAMHAGFILGPCLNASGRLDSAERALRLFTDCTDPEEAGRAAQELRELNESRKSMTEQGIRESDERIAKEHLTDDKVLVLYLPDCHESICGIVAGKVKEKYYRPTFVMTDAENPDRLKGSGRSIEAYDMYGEMNRVSDLFAEDHGRKLFGGHKMAAGFTIPRANLAAFRRRLNDNCRLKEIELTEPLYFDMVLPPSALTESMIEEFDLLEPCGNGNRRPLFACRNMTVLSAFEMGKNRNALKLMVEDEPGSRWPALWFGNLKSVRDSMDGYYGTGTYESLLRRDPVCTVRGHLAYQPNCNEYRGQRTIQLILKDIIWI